ncbi:uncharacterized protein TRIVIDRAFT_48848 [Trichoderma virens Gv29-8]|uniref:Bactericidal permeability-increasing protein n=1 Tax=Hypocrea virens (strain Gv29-8 / FGSC 10586) TaxID=413071 RepID=G9MYK1_HYPVG|nr:uncharacterized protein TRIVIDRAFT_48848 [Trichoderma virens Gv29-8]EHK20621.1 hypothetical protein TRIVIDRAFT_48848 [Trichoderma virens Gv29-8]UKZ53081.1 hypothetical protein TrVGV298_006869 [Trichoderma virens]
MFSWLALSHQTSRRRDEEHQPLLPEYNEATQRQTRLHEKLHTYQMLRALSNGYMPSNEQIITHLRTLLAADVLNPQASGLSPSGRALVRTTRMWLSELIDLLKAKNSNDQVQDFLWYLAKARLEVDSSDLHVRASTAKMKADVMAAVASVKTVGSLLLTNSDFRIFLTDLSTVSREVFRDTAFTLRDVAHDTGKKIEPPKEKQQALKHANGDAQPAPSTEDLQQEVIEVAEIVADGAGDVLETAARSAREHIQGEEQEALTYRLKQAVLRLRQRPNYSDSVSTLSLLLRRYLKIYSRAAARTAEVIEEDVGMNPEADEALHNFWLLVTSFGNKNAWNRVEKSFNEVVETGQSDPAFEDLVDHLSKLVQDILMDPDFFNNAEKRFEEIRAESKELTTETSIREKVDDLLGNLSSALRSVSEDAEVTQLINSSTRIAHIVSPKHQYINSDMSTDLVNVFVPLLIQGIQYLPIPRLEVSTPDVDLLLENLVLEPGRTINNTSFLPYRLQVSTRNDVDIRKARFQILSTVTSVARIKISGLSIAAEELGYWLHLHSGILRFMDEGLASIHLDERGIDLLLDIEIGRDRLEKIVSLRKASVRIHHLNYTLRRSKFSFMAWLLKPLIRPIVKRALEKSIASAIEDGLHTLNRELVFARERLRATRIASPEDLWTFIRAVAARLVPRPHPDIEARIGVRPEIFRGRYAPGSLVQLWEREAQDASQKIYEYERGGWRNDIFGVRTRPA